MGFFCCAVEVPFIHCVNNSLKIKGNEAGQETLHMFGSIIIIK